MRVRRGETTDKEVENTRKELLRSISDTLRTSAESLPEDEEGRASTGPPQTLGAYSKNLSLQSKAETEPSSSKRGEPTYQELQEKIRELQTTIQRMGLLSSQGHLRSSDGGTRITPNETKRSEKGAEHEEVGNEDSEVEWAEQRERKQTTSRQGLNTSHRVMETRVGRTEDSDSDYDELRRTNRRESNQNRNRGPGRDDRRSLNLVDERQRNSRPPIDEWFSERGSYASDGFRNRNSRQNRRIEHWKLTFSGDSRAISVENFLYKLKKIAAREGVSQQGLLRDIHLVLEGQASDWFFTYVDDFVDWEDFEETLRRR